MTAEIYTSNLRNRRIFMRILFPLFVFLFCFELFAVNADQYPISTINVIVAGEKTKIEKDNKGIALHITMLGGGIPFRVIGRWTGNARPISSDTVQFLEMYAKYRKMDLLSLFKNEIEFIDSDGDTYWIPIQDSFHDAFVKEIQTPKKSVLLYLIMCGFLEENPVFLMNEFYAFQN